MRPGEGWTSGITYFRHDRPYFHQRHRFQIRSGEIYESLELNLRHCKTLAQGTLGVVHLSPSSRLCVVHAIQLSNGTF